MWVEELIEAVRAGGDGAEEAAVAIGLLLEDPLDREAVEAVLGDEFLAIEITADDRHAAVDSLIRYVDETSDPHPTAVWALSKAGDEAALYCFDRVLDRFGSDEQKEPVIFQAVVAATSFPSMLAAGILQKAQTVAGGTARNLAAAYLDASRARGRQQ